MPPISSTALTVIRDVRPIPEPPSDESPIQMLGGRYEMGALIGLGGSAKVYSAWDRDEDRMVAVKLLRKRHAGDFAMRRRFQVEVEANMRVKHPHLVCGLAHGEYASRPYLVLELVDGRSLADELSRRSTMPPKDALLIARQVAEGLCEMHRAGVVHRDVTLTNVMLADREDDDYFVKVADFGIARLDNTSITATGIAVGTRAFMAPEQVVAEEVDPRTDVYSLGTVMFTMLTGVLPFSGSEHQHLAHQLLSTAPPPSWFLDGLDPMIDAIVTRAMRKDPANRYPTMDAMLDDLRAALEKTNAQAAVDEPSASDTPGDEYVPNSTSGHLILQRMKKALKR